MFYRKSLATFIQIESIAGQIAQRTKSLPQSISHAFVTQQDISALSEVKLAYKVSLGKIFLGQLNTD
jgi:hypothetical protein